MQKLRGFKEALVAKAEKAGKKPRRGPAPAETMASMQEAGLLAQKAADSMNTGEGDDKQNKQKPEDKLFNKVVDDHRIRAAMRAQPYTFRSQC